MTILGAVAGAEQAVVWCDTLITSRTPGRPNWTRPKIAINPLSGAVGAGCGWHSLLEIADRELLRGSDFDETVTFVVDVLRTAIPSVIHSIPEQHRFAFSDQIYLVTGWSPQYERMVTWEMSGSAFFEPSLRSQALWPPTPRQALGVPSHTEVLELAAEQAAILASQDCAVGLLNVVTINRHGIQVLPPSTIAPARLRVAPGADATAGPRSDRGSAEAQFEEVS